MAIEVLYGSSIRELQELAYQFAKKIGIVYPTGWDTDCQASKDWYYAFMHRNKNPSLRTPEQVSFNKANVPAFFTNLGIALDQEPYEPHRIWNIDETGCPTVPTKTTKVVAEKGARRVGVKSLGERGTNVSLAYGVSATGLSIPPFYISPRKNMQKIFMDNAGPGFVGVATESGWTNAEEFVKFMAHFIKHAQASTIRFYWFSITTHPISVWSS